MHNLKDLRERTDPKLVLVRAREVKPVMWFFVFLVALSALDAYDLGSVPLQWIMQAAAIVGVGYIALTVSLPRPLGSRSLWLLFLWSVVITTISALFNHFASQMPKGATTPYVFFLSLRFLTQLFFIATLYLIFWMARQGFRDQMVKATVIAGTVVSILAIYIYVAQLYGLPEPPRSRIGTSGGLQAVRFTYDFHRATGTFREPSLLAAWLIVPFFLSFTIRNRLSYAAAIVIGGTVLLTGSLSGILAIALGLVVVMMTMFASDRMSSRTPFLMLGVVALAIVIFYLLAVSNTNGGVNLFATLGHRIAPILKGGLENSDRNLVYGYVGHHAPPLLGYGLGNANLELTHYLHTKVIASFISLYLNTLYAMGYLGVILLGWFLLTPVFKVAGSTAFRRNETVMLTMAPYVAWLVVFSVAMEELTFMFAVVCALLSYQLVVPAKQSWSVPIAGSTRPAAGDQLVVLAPCDYYLPGYKAGGPIRTLAGAVERLQDEFLFKVVTRDRDLGDTTPYLGVAVNGWQSVGAAQVKYLAPSQLNPPAIRMVIAATSHDVLYLNSCFSIPFTIVPLLLRRYGLVPKRPVILGPRGELAPGALAIRPARKRIYIVAARLFGLTQDIVWQASGPHEARHIRRWFGSQARVVVAPDLAVASQSLAIRQVEKRPGHLRLIFLSRISRMKNLDGALTLLQGVDGSIHFSIYGPIEDAAYWAHCQELIRKLPPNLKVEYRGPAEPENVGTLMAQHDVFFLPTLGEAFGHVIIEALSSGCPVLISDRTRWRHLESAGVGWDVSLDDQERFREILRRCLAMDAKSWSELSSRARSYADRSLNDSEALQKYRALFKSVTHLGSVAVH